MLYDCTFIDPVEPLARWYARVLLVTPHAFGQQPTNRRRRSLPPPSAIPAIRAPGGGTVPIMQPQPTSVPGRPTFPTRRSPRSSAYVSPPPFPRQRTCQSPSSSCPRASRSRSMPVGSRMRVTAGDKGTVFVSNRQLDKVYAIVDRQGKREVKVIASGLDRPNGLAFHNGTLYIAEAPRFKLEKIEDSLDNPPKPVVIYNNFLNHQSHGWKFMGLGPDNKLYVNVGAPCNICEPPATNGQIRRIASTRQCGRGRARSAQLGRL